MRGGLGLGLVLLGLGLLGLSLSLFPPPAPPAYRLACVLCETGRYAFVGLPGAQVLRAWHPPGVEMESVDSQGDAHRALAEITRLAADPRVIGVIGPALTDETLELIAHADQLKLPCLSISAADRSQPRNPWVFRLPITNYHMVYQIGDYLVRHNLKRVALISVETGFGKGGRQELRRQAAELGLELAADVVSPDRRLLAPEAQALVAQAMEAHPQALIVWWSGAGAADLTLAARAQGVSVPLFHSGGIASPDFLKVTGEASEGVLFPGSPLLIPAFLPGDHPQGPPIRDFSDFCRAHELAVSTFGGYAWDAAHLLTSAVQAVGADRAKVRAYLETLQNYPATAGVFHFTPEDHNGLTHDSFLMLRVHQGRWEPAEP